MKPDAVRVWDAKTGELILALKGHTGPVLCVAFSPDDGQLVSAGGALSRFAELKVWDASTGREIRNLTGHTDQVRSVAFSPDGRRLATGSNDRTIKLWDTSVYRDVFTLRWHTAGVTVVAFSPDGTRLLSGSIDRTAEIWDLNARELTELYRREAVALVRRLFDELRDKSRVVEAIRADTTLGAPMRRHVLDLAERAAEGPSAVLLRAESLGRRGDWAGAATAFATALEHEPYDLEFRRLHILSLLEAGDDPGYQMAAVDLLKRLGGSTDADVMNHVAWPCLIAPGAESDHRAPVRLAEEALLRYPGMQTAAGSTTSIMAQGARPKLSHDWGQGLEVFQSLQKRFDPTVLGAALYRIGNFDEAIRLIEQGIKNRGNKSSPKDWAFLAMAYHRKGDREQAHLWLGKLLARQPDTDREHFWDEVEIQLLRHEAEALLKGSAFPSDPFAH